VRQAGGGALLEHSIHSVDILNWLFGPVSRVFALTRNVYGYEVEDTATLTIEHDNGVVGNLVTIFNGMRGREERRLEVFFENGVIELTTDFVIGAKEDSFMVQRPDQAPERLDVAAMREAFFTGIGVTRRDMFFYQYISDRAWLGSVRAQTTATPGFADAFAAHAVVEAAYRSARSRQPVDLAGELTLA
jgi:predicted dehydrogenase